MNYLRLRKSSALFSSRGNVESFLTILPQVVIFLISLQLVFLALNRNIGGYLDQKEIAQTAIGVSNQRDYERFSLAGGGDLLIRNRDVKQQNLLSYFWPSKVQLISIVVDESSIQ